MTKWCSLFSHTVFPGFFSVVPVSFCRHGRKHNVNPTNVNYRANMWALRAAGCTHVLVTTACGSLQEDIHPSELVLLDQFIDRTTQRRLSCYDGTPGGPKGVCHVPMAQPFCKIMRQVIPTRVSVYALSTGISLFYFSAFCFCLLRSTSKYRSVRFFLVHLFHLKESMLPSRKHRKISKEIRHALILLLLFTSLCRLLLTQQLSCLWPATMEAQWCASRALDSALSRRASCSARGTPMWWIWPRCRNVLSPMNWACAMLPLPCQQIMTAGKSTKPR